MTVEELLLQEPNSECPNCQEPTGQCACMRNKCIRCDDCWEKEHYINKGWDERVWGRDLPNDDTTNSK